MKLLSMQRFWSIYFSTEMIGIVSYRFSHKTDQDVNPARNGTKDDSESKQNYYIAVIIYLWEEK